MSRQYFRRVELAMLGVVMEINGDTYLGPEHTAAQAQEGAERSYHQMAPPQQQTWKLTTPLKNENKNHIDARMS